MKKVFYIIGVGIVAGTVVATAAHFLMCKGKKGSRLDHDPGEESVFADDGASTEGSIIHGDTYRNSTIGSMCSRHKDAAIIMNDSVEQIRENIKAFESTNNEIDELSAELDKMLSED